MGNHRLRGHPVLLASPVGSVCHRGNILDRHRRERIPLIVCSTLGGTVAPYLSYKNSILVLFASFLRWSLGVRMSFMLVPIKVWRLISNQLPYSALVISTLSQSVRPAWERTQLSSCLPAWRNVCESTTIRSPIHPSRRGTVLTLPPLEKLQ
jgi:hypothetical protein